MSQLSPVIRKQIGHLRQETINAINERVQIGVPCPKCSIKVVPRIVKVSNCVLNLPPTFTVPASDGVIDGIQVLCWVGHELNVVDCRIIAKSRTNHRVSEARAIPREVRVFRDKPAFDLHHCERERWHNWCRGEQCNKVATDRWDVRSGQWE